MATRPFQSDGKPWPCPSCRYDLRGTCTDHPENVVCPECGTRHPFTFLQFVRFRTTRPVTWRFWFCVFGPFLVFPFVGGILGYSETAAVEGALAGLGFAWLIAPFLCLGMSYYLLLYIYPLSRRIMCAGVLTVILLLVNVGFSLLVGCISVMIGILLDQPL